MKKIVLNTVTAVLFCIANVGKAFADEPIPPSPYGGDDEGVPIDMAVIWLITAGILLACYFALKQKRAVRQE